MLILHKFAANNSIKYECIDMAKKKSRSANIARKREKRNRDRKSKQKQIAVAKQRNLHSEKIDEERLHTYLVQSLDLLEEPELEKIHFDVDLMHKVLARMFTESDETVSAEVEIAVVELDTEIYKDDDIRSISQDAEEVLGLFRTEILPQLITPKFMHTLSLALTACEKRLRHQGDRDQAELALVTNSLLEAAPPHIIVEHPLIQHIGLKSMGLLVDKLPIKEENPIVGNILSGVLETESDSQDNEELSSTLSNAITEKGSLIQGEPPHASNSSLLIPDNDEPISLPSPDTLPAKALYKNFDGLAIKDVLKEWQTDTLEKETDTQLDLFFKEQALYITVTEDRVQLHTHSSEELTEAMESLEAHCESAIMFLAKTIDEGGRQDATE